MMNFRTFRRITTGNRGLAIGFGIPQDDDTDRKVRALLASWTVVLTSDAPMTVAWADMMQIRKLSQVPWAMPVILFGFGPGNLTVRAMLLSQMIQPMGVGVFGDVPLSDWGPIVWASLAERVKAGQGVFVAHLAPGPGAGALVKGLGDTAKGVTTEAHLAAWDVALVGLAGLAEGPPVKG